MKLKYYLRGLGIGVIVTTIILAISFGGKKDDIDNIPEEEVIAKATMLGMVMPEETEELPTEQQDAVDEILNSNTEDITQEETVKDGNTEIPENPVDTADTDVAQDNAYAAQADEDTGEDETSPETQVPYRLVVNRGDVCRTICENLAANGVIDDAEAFRKYLSEIGYASNISTGNYDIPYQLTYEEIANVLKNGPIEEVQ